MAIVNRYHPRYCPADQHICIQNVCLSGCMIDYVPEQPKPAIDTAALDRAVRHSFTIWANGMGWPLEPFCFDATGNLLPGTRLPSTFVVSVRGIYRDIIDGRCLIDVPSQHSAKIAATAPQTTPGGSSWMSA